MAPARRAGLFAASLAALLGGAQAQQQPAATPAPAPEPATQTRPSVQALATGVGLPSFAELEAAGARVGQIRIRNLNIFDLDDPKENNALFRLANALHIQTRPGVIGRAVLLKTGDPVSVRLVEETERLLRTNRYLYDVRLQPYAYSDGVVDVEVQTRDTWSLDPGVSFGRSGGSNSSGFSLREYNLLGTGAALSLAHSNNVDRSGNEFQIQYNRAFDGWTSLSYLVADNTDGRRHEASILRPFYALDARWAAGATVASDDRIESLYSAGVVASQYRVREKTSEVFAGWSDGLVRGWTRRLSVGVKTQDDAYQFEPALVAPAALPADQKLLAPFLRFELIEDNFQRRDNRNQMGRPEFFALGLAAKVQIGRASTALGSSQDLWLYNGSVSQGFNPRPNHDLLASASVSGQYGDGRIQRQLLSAALKYYLPLSPRYLLFGSASVDALKNPGLSDLLTLGGDNGLRGYPLRYQTGEQRALFTLEARTFTDLYLYRLFRVGAAAFYDVGRAWGGPNANPAQQGWLANAGVGLRIFNVRAAFGNVLHVDIAAPLQREPGIKTVQFLVKSKVSF